jgi:hypothetical protein
MSEPIDAGELDMDDPMYAGMASQFGHSKKPPPIVLELHIADASILLAELLAVTERTGHVTVTGSTAHRLKHITTMLGDAMRRWPAPDPRRTGMALSCAPG